LEVEHLGWSAHFRRVIGAGDAIADKPHPAPVAKALEGSGIPPEKAWFVGDTALDMKCAQSAGAVPVLLGSGEAIPADESDGLPSLRFADCVSLLTQLRGL
jgi:phosphoglycolate phosphatase